LAAGATFYCHLAALTAWSKCKSTSCPGTTSCPVFDDGNDVADLTDKDNLGGWAKVKVLQDTGLACDAIGFASIKLIVQ
jgi:hypothetical protein